MEIKKNVSMKNHTSFKIGGTADEFAEVENVEQIIELIEYAKNKHMPYTIIGNGTNLLVSDKGIRGLVIQLSNSYSNSEVDGNLIKADSGCLLTKLSLLALKNNLEGMEFASGIPGTLGGAIYMNAGAYGGEMKAIVKSVTYLQDGKVKTIYKDELEFGYRKSRFTNNDAVIVSAEIELKTGNREEIKAKMDDYRQRRTDKQPLLVPSAGSTFKRPEGYFAGKLIEDAGLKGYRIGDAMVSDKHSGFVVNAGNATCEEILDLIRHIQVTVFEKFGVELETEVRMMGEF